LVHMWDLHIMMSKRAWPSHSSTSPLAWTWMVRRQRMNATDFIAWRYALSGIVPNLRRNPERLEPQWLQITLVTTLIANNFSELRTRLGEAKQPSRMQTHGKANRFSRAATLEKSLGANRGHPSNWAARFGMRELKKPSHENQIC